MNDQLAFLRFSVPAKEALTPGSEMASWLWNTLTAEEIATMRAGQTGILSITVYGEKPAATCAPGAGCC